jgi:transposase
MSNDTSRIEIITGRERRRRYTAEHKLQLVEEGGPPSVLSAMLLGWRRCFGRA